MTDGSETTKYNLRSWVLALALIPTVVVGFLLASFFTINRSIELEQNNLDRIEQITVPAALAISVSIASNNRDEAKRLLTQMQIYEPKFIKSIAVFDANNQLLVTSHYHKDFDNMRYDSSLVTLKQSEVEDIGEFILVKTPIFSLSQAEIDNPDFQKSTEPHGNFLGYITMLVTKEETIESQYTAIIVAFIVFLAGIQLNLLFTIRLVKFFTIPVNSMVLFVSKIRQGKFVEKIDGAFISELDTLKSGINSMAKSLNIYKNETQNNIEQATSDLLKTLEQIEIQNIELDIAKKRAQAASQTKSEFLANMSHELRTPLNGVIGFSRQLAKTPLHKSQLEYIQTIERSASNLLNIINDILDFSKLEAGKMVIENIPFCLRDSLDETMTLTAAAAHQKGLEIVIDVAPNVPDNVIGDAMHLNQIITNLVGNAIKFTENGSILLKVSLVSEHLKRAIIRFDVVDTGIGINLEHQQLLFQAFAQADASISRRFGGTGLGLIITQRLVDELGGEISFSSEENQGSNFWFSIPLELCQFQLSDSIPLHSLNNKSVLVYEPRSLSAEMLSTSLKSWNTHFRIASSTQDILEKLNSSLQYQYLLLSCHDICSETDLLKILKLARPKVDRIILIHDCLKQDHLIDRVRPYTDNIIKTPFTALALAKQMLFSQQISVPVELDKPIQPLKSKHNINVLAVDDNQANLKLIKTLLNDIVSNVTIAPSGTEAIEYAKTKNFDLILMDIQMPDIDGIQATNVIRRDSLNHNTPIIAVTAHALSDEKQRIFDSGMEGYLPKPIDEKALNDIIEQWVIRPTFTHFDSHTLNWELCLSQASQKAPLAIEMLQMLLASLPETVNELNQGLQTQDNDKMLSIVHKLHGACCYCGVPTTQKLCNQIESSLKQGETIEMLEPEILELLDELTKVESAAKQVISQMSME
ncbi:two-component sensor histidine kinase BarA [Parashewanella spongiae]|uniref:histidine kinase n=1 Tax=Parashewanella spongiae TaxID=342950 RepID=A0A3A6UKC7_9GAMM|nr:two-component sensor histidine kinase BarA [Parashewanella spongiae]MCL1077805.1 two-component sensor histidine kinase BarA [Parashewanella spongiae]RJY18019.1 two-component sensor histidine kinase BarA [Parashewanella spongiae]